MADAGTHVAALELQCNGAYAHWLTDWHSFTHSLSHSLTCSQSEALLEQATTDHCDTHCCCCCCWALVITPNVSLSLSFIFSAHVRVMATNQIRTRVPREPERERETGVQKESSLKQSVTAGKWANWTVNSKSCKRKRVCTNLC